MTDPASRRRLPGALGFGVPLALSALSAMLVLLVLSAMLVLLVEALAYIARVDPHRPGTVFPLCPFRLLTGWNCPACGGLRMVHDVLHGQLAAAMTDNAFLLIGFPMLAVWILLSRRRGHAIPPAATVVVIAAAAFAWTLLRNLPGFPLVPTTLPTLPTLPTLTG